MHECDVLFFFFLFLFFVVASWKFNGEPSTLKDWRSKYLKTNKLQQPAPSSFQPCRLTGRAAPQRFGRVEARAESNSIALHNKTKKTTLAGEGQNSA
jgi:hypothetical protein